MGNSMRLVFDGLVIYDSLGGNESDGYTLVTSGEDADFGTPAPIEVALASLVRDGALTKWDRDENREMSFLVRIEGVDGAGLDAGLEALHRATHKRTTLEFTPPDGFGQTRIYDVHTSSLEATKFDRHAALRCEATYRLRIVAEPYWREQELVTETAEGIPSVGTVVDACEATAGWSAPAAPADNPSLTMLAVDAGEFIEGTGSVAVRCFSEGAIDAPGDPHPASFTATRTGLSEEIASGAYVSFAAKFEETAGYFYAGTSGPVWETSKFSLVTLHTSLGDRSLDPTLAIVQALADGWKRYTWRIGEALTVTGFTWAGTQQSAQSTKTYPRTWFDQIAVAESTALGKQVLKSIAVQGSARTTGSLHVAAPSDAVALGQVIAFTVPQDAVASGFRPDVRQWVQPGATTVADADATDGQRFSAVSTGSFGGTGSPVFEAPASLFMSGGHTIAARVRAGAPGSHVFAVQAELVVSGVVVGGPEVVELTWTAVDGWQIISLGTLYLPPVAIQSPTTSALVRIKVRGSVNLDDVYAFPDVGDLTLVDCGLGTVGPNASSHLWVDSPSATQQRGGYWRGTSAAKQDALAAWSTTDVPGVHTFDSGTMLAFVACTGAQGPTVDFEYHPRRF